MEVFFEDTKPFKIKKSVLKKYIISLISNELKKTGSITIIFCSDNYLLEMNKKYLEHDYFTDIITFDYVENDIISGDLFISVDRVKENAEKFNTTFLNELVRVIFHGVLHLAGYKDKTTPDQQLMREKENFYLSGVDLSEMEL
ncbi:MAG TPA: rRNA maturation RNase YbeY [Prolixibacteraceae bacterium]|nr:rRNA maturation RNase YbeY [Prolixibacteraceae bacterium]